MVQLNIGINTIIEYLSSVPELAPNGEITLYTKLSDAQYEALQKRFQKDRMIKEASKTIKKLRKNGPLTVQSKPPVIIDNALSGKPLIETIKVQLKDLHFEHHWASYRKGSETFVLFDSRMSKYINLGIGRTKIENIAAIITLNRNDHSFIFNDANMLPDLEKISLLSEQEAKELKKKKKEQKKIEKNQKENSLPESNVKVEHRIIFSSLRFREGRALFTYKKEKYTFRANYIKDFSSIIRQCQKNCTRKEKGEIKNYSINVVIDKRKHSFVFLDFDLCRFVTSLKEKYSRTSHKEKYSKVVESSAVIEQPSQSQIAGKVKLGVENIEFYNGYYVIVLIKNGIKDLSITPLTVVDSHSNACLRYVHRYFSERFPDDIDILYSKTKITGLTKPYILNKYIKVLHNNIDVRGDWWEEVQNERKLSLKQCRNASRAEVQQKVSLTNGYLDNLVGFQNDKNLISVYEINHGIEEKAFIFSVDLPNNRCAIIFENISYASTATEIFIAKNENYESCVNLVFSYFTDYSIYTKRDSLRKGINPPEKFHAEKYCYLVHNELSQWLINLNEVLERTNHASVIEFVHGLHVPRDKERRSGHEEFIETKNIHNELMRKLYDRLCVEYGEQNVGTEIRVGSKRIDTVVRKQNSYDIYEIKSDPDPFVCVTKALGQICQYAYLYCRDNIEKMVIVGSSKAPLEVDKYLSWFRDKYSLQVYYINV